MAQKDTIENEEKDTKILKQINEKEIKMQPN